MIRIRFLVLFALAVTQAFCGGYRPVKSVHGKFWIKIANNKNTGIQNELWFLDFDVRKFEEIEKHIDITRIKLKDTTDSRYDMELARHQNCSGLEEICKIDYRGDSTTIEFLGRTVTVVKLYFDKQGAFAKMGVREFIPKAVDPENTYVSTVTVSPIQKSVLVKYDSK